MDIQYSMPHSGLFLCLFHVLSEQLRAVGTVCVCFREDESARMSNARMQRPREKKGVPQQHYYEQNVSAIFSRSCSSAH